MKRSVANLPLHTGKAPRWLFRRMVRLAGAVTMAVVDRFGPDEMLRRLAQPWWFQAFGCVLGFDWHSSGVTTVTCGALKAARKEFGRDLGIIVAGGKGGTSRRTPREIADATERHGIGGGERLIYASRISAKVDSAALQDGYQLYHHIFFFSPTGAWCVVQQGMNAEARMARRYHWLGEHVRDFVCEPHEYIRDLGDKNSPPPALQNLPLLNMVAAEAEDNRAASAELVRENPDKILREFQQADQGPTLFAPRAHRIPAGVVNMPRLRKIIVAAHERAPRDFRTLLGTAGVGPVTVRALSLLAEIIYDAPASHRDPCGDLPPSRRKWADYSHAHGGKDGHPFPVDRDAYDKSISVLLDAVRKARMGNTEKTRALERLAKLGA